ncbi:MAG: ABC transporter ATP-binding protein [Spirochaetales bacterium]|nr:ABC transporter ATP-binding protein [Spirochaetales bacterium]
MNRSWRHIWVASTSEVILTVENLTAGYGEADVLTEVSIKLHRGEIVSVIGPNGAGKSTLLKTIFGFLIPTHGAIRFLDEQIDGLKPDVIVQRGISYVPQVQNIFPSLTVQENLEMGAFIREDDYKGRIEEVYELFPMLQEARERRSGNLSGGQRQLVALGRALMLDPEVLLLDEPSASLAPLFVSMIFEKIQEINGSGVSIILVEQNAREALGMADRGYVLAAGRNAMEGEGKVLLADEDVGSLYLGG